MHGPRLKEKEQGTWTAAECGTRSIDVIFHNGHLDALFFLLSQRYAYYLILGGKRALRYEASFRDKIFCRS